jgi:hypothetical protein
MGRVSISSVTTSAFGQKCPEKCAGVALLPREYYRDAMPSTKVAERISSFATAFLQHKYMPSNTDLDIS